MEWSEEESVRGDCEPVGEAEDKVQERMGKWPFVHVNVC